MKRTPLARVRFQRKPKRKKAGPKQPDERKAYKERFPEDEWRTILGITQPAADDDPRRWMPNEINHIWTNPRRHVVPCIITLSKINHDFFHRNLDVGRMLSMLVKCSKGEADLELWNKAFGKNVCVICDRPACMEPQYEQFRLQLIGWLAVLATELEEEEAA